MLKNKDFPCLKTFFPLLFVVVVFCTSSVQASRPGWRRKEVDLRMTGGGRIKAISYPQGRPPNMLKKHIRCPHKLRLKRISFDNLGVLAEKSTEFVYANVIDSPPLEGFVPWIVLAVTDETVGGDFNAYASTDVVGDYLTDNPQSDYAVGIFDTGSSTTLISYDAAVKTGIYGNGLVTSLPVELSGVIGSATVYTTDPLAIFIAGLDILEPNGLLLDDSQMIGEYNVSVLAGDPIDSPNVPTVTGTSLSVYCCAAFCNNKQLSVTIDGNDFNSPYIKFYGLSDPCVPSYSSGTNLELYPSDASAVQYFPCELLEACAGEPSGTPVYPSMIWGLLSSQSLYFVPWVNVADGNESGTQFEFMFDTGAQVTVISPIIAAGLKLDTENPDFTVDIMDVTGQVAIAPGFCLDSLDIAATGQWLEYTNVPVVMLDVPAPGGGNLNGIIGMNLFVDLNFVFKGGGMMGQGYTPRLEFESACSITGDIAGDCYQCLVNYSDLAALSDAWLAVFNPRSDNWNLNADLAPLQNPDGKIDFLDFAILSEHWLESIP